MGFKVLLNCRLWSFAVESAELRLHDHLEQFFVPDKTSHAKILMIFLHQNIQSKEYNRACFEYKFDSIMPPPKKKRKKNDTNES